MRWLHISDLHVGKDDYGQRSLFRSIMDHVRSRVVAGIGPNVIFVSGDIANNGAVAQYQVFGNDFLMPLLDIVGDNNCDRVFVVPGNHDINRSVSKAIDTYTVLNRVPTILDPTPAAHIEREPLLARFSPFTEADLTVDSTNHWLTSNQGFLTHTLILGGKTIGILLLNTAWLCNSGDDRHKLSPGKPMLEEGLHSIANCDVRIVMGHHPLSWFRDEEVASIKTLFSRHSVIYLHGHLHRNEAADLVGAGGRFLTLQSGAAFMTREDDQWVNRIMWCEISEGGLMIEPLKWSRPHQEWAFDGDALPQEYISDACFRMPWPLAVFGQARKTLISGWKQLAPDMFLQKAPSIDRILSFFDGRSPDWEDVRSGVIPELNIVHNVTKQILQSHEENTPALHLLYGAGGEGKSTVLRQVAVKFYGMSDWKVLWRNETGISLPDISKLPEGPWLVVSDDGEDLGRNCFEAMKTFQELNRKDVFFLLAARDTDWRAAQLDHLPWYKYGVIRRTLLRGLTLNDARSVVAAWAKFGEKGLRSLAGINIEKAASKLFEAARSEQSREEGAFLGATLSTRLADGLREHIADLLSRFHDRPAPGGSLLDAFARIAVPHSIGELILSKTVLAEALGCSEKEVFERVISPLGEEALVTGPNRVVATRHRVISIAATHIMADTYGIDLDEILIDLVIAAEKAARDGKFVDNHRSWRFLSSNVFQKGNVALAIRIAQHLHDFAPQDIYLTTNLARLLREANDSERAVELFSKMPSQPNTRIAFSEWGTCCSANNDYYESVVLIGIGLADQIEQKHVDNDTAKVALASLGLSLFHIYETYRDTKALKSSVAAGILGRKLRLDNKTARYFKDHIYRGVRNGVDPRDIVDPLGILLSFVRAAQGEYERSFPSWLPKASELSYKGLARLLKISVPMP